MGFYQDSRKQVNYLIALCFILATVVGVLSAFSVRTHFAAKQSKAVVQQLKEDAQDQAKDDKRVLLMVKPKAPAAMSLYAKAPIKAQVQAKKPRYKPFVSTYVQRRYVNYRD